MWSWLFVERYTAIEVGVAILLAALPMSQIASIALGAIQKKTGIKVETHDDS